jgi:hypothetical protein
VSDWLERQGNQQGALAQSSPSEVAVPRKHFEWKRGQIQSVKARLHL